MKKKITALILVLMLFSGVAVASSINGDFDGNAIVRVKSNGKTLPVEDAPAVVYHDRTMVPIYMLRNLGFDVQWNDAEFSVDVKPKVAATDMRDVLAKTGGNIKYETIGHSLNAAVDYTKKQDFNADWNDIYGIFTALADLDPDYIKVNYVDGGKVVGTVVAKSSDIRDVVAGRITGEQMSEKWITTGDLTAKTPLTAKEIAKLVDRVAYVYMFDANNKMLGQGSGFMIDPGYFITNYHVGGGGTGLQIYLDGSVYSTNGEYLIQNQTADVFGVVIGKEHDPAHPERVTGGFPTKTFSYTTQLPEVGDKVYAIGSPLGLNNTVSEGIVSAVRTINGMTMIQHTCNTDHGSSGGALLNEYGQVLGITSAGYEATDLDFAVPMMYVQTELDKIK